MPADPQDLLVHESADGRRVDQFLAHRLPEYSRAFLQRLIDQGEVRVEGEVVRRSHRVTVGQTVQLTIPDVQPWDVPAEEIPLDVVHEDSDLIVVNKARGMVVHPNTHDRSGTLVNALLHRVDDLSGVGGVERPGIVHRIDKDTSGLLVVAKNDRAHHGLSDQFRDHSIERTYVALVWGRPFPESGTLRSTIGRDRHDRRKQSSRTNKGRDSITHYRVVEEYGPASMVACTLETGRTHQIRVHLSEELGNPLLGDYVYGGTAKDLLGREPKLRPLLAPIRGQLLHAATLGFIHPGTDAWVRFAVAPPAVMLEVIRALRVHAGGDPDAPGPWDIAPTP